MKEVCLRSQMNGKEIEELFNYILKVSNYNLDQYVKSDALSIPNDMDEQFVDSIKKLLDIMPEVVKTISDKEQFWNAFHELDNYENNDKFIKWLIKYVENAIRPFEDASFLREMEEDTFSNMVDYCFQNLIIKDIGKNEVRKSDWDAEKMGVMRKITFTFIDMVVCDNFSKERAYEHMSKMFSLKERFLDKLWTLIEENREELWKIMVLKKFQRLENKLDHILDLIEE